MSGVPFYCPEETLSALETEMALSRLKAGEGRPNDLAATLAVRRLDVVVRALNVRRLKKEYPFLFTTDGVSLRRYCGLILLVVSFMLFIRGIFF